MAATKRNADTRPNSRDSLVMMASSARGTGRAVGVPGLRRGRVRVRVAGLTQRVGRAHALLPGRDEPLVLVERDRAQLEVHLRGVGAGELRATAAVRASLL